MGTRVTPLQLQAEWLEYKQIFSDILERFGAQLARDVKAEKKRLEREFAPEPSVVPAAHPASKAELRSKIFRKKTEGFSFGADARDRRELEPPEWTNGAK